MSGSVCQGPGERHPPQPTNRPAEFISIYVVKHKCSPGRPANLAAVAGLVDALEDRQNPEVRGTAAVALRHWTSRNADNDLELYRTLYEKKGYSREKAEIIMRLLHSFSEAELNNPGTYQTLIGYLNHDNLAIRDLAFWHLYQLVPEGAKQIPYDAADAPDKRRQVIEQWKRLIPEGRLPPGINVRGAK